MLSASTDEIPRMIYSTESVGRGSGYESAAGPLQSGARPEFGTMAQSIGLTDYQSMLITANERGNFPNDNRKQDPLGFVLWQAQATWSTLDIIGAGSSWLV